MRSIGCVGSNSEKRERGWWDHHGGDKVIMTDHYHLTNSITDMLLRRTLCLACYCLFSCWTLCWWENQSWKWALFLYWMVQCNVSPVCRSSAPVCQGLLSMFPEAPEAPAQLLSLVCLMNNNESPCQLPAHIRCTAAWNVHICMHGHVCRGPHGVSSDLRLFVQELLFAFLCLLTSAWAGRCICSNWFGLNESFSYPRLQRRVTSAS